MKIKPPAEAFLELFIDPPEPPLPVPSPPTPRTTEVDFDVEDTEIDPFFEGFLNKN